MDYKLIVKALEVIVINPWLMDRLMPNVPTPVLDWGICWNNLAESSGWRVQKNTLTGHCRIVDDNNYRRAWGSESAVMELFHKILKN
ncbi:MAG: hypothetical protein KBA47_00235 [Caldisericia bacterium]|nr:hypothetical protein [Caldisericia bacterium]